MKRWTKNVFTIFLAIFLLIALGFIYWHASKHLPYKIDAINDGTMTIAEAQEHGLDLSRTFTVPYYILIFIRCFIFNLFLVYIIMSSFNKLTFKELFSYGRKYFVFLVSFFACFLVECTLVVLVGYIFVNASAEANKINTDLGLKRSYVADYKAEVTYSKQTKVNQKTIESGKVDYSSVLINGKSDVNISEFIVNNYSSGTSELNGRNSAIAIRDANSTDINQIISNTYGNNSPVLYVRNSDYTVVDRFTGNSSGQRSAIVNTNSYVEIRHYTFETSGDTGLEIVNNGLMKLDEGSLTVMGEDSDKKIYIRGNENRGTGYFYMSNSSLNVNGGTLFNVMNNDSEIHLSHVGIVSKKALDNFIKIHNSSTSLSLSEQAISGKIILGDKSKLSLELVNGSIFVGSIPESEDSVVNLSMDATSKIVLTGDMYINSFENDVSLKDHVVTNGYSVYLDGVKVL